MPDSAKNASTVSEQIQKERQTECRDDREREKRNVTSKCPRKEDRWIDGTQTGDVRRNL